MDKAWDVPDYSFRLRWAGPWERSDVTERYPSRAIQDAKAASKYGCDIPIFLVFNDYSNSEGTDGHKFSGLTQGGACESSIGSGYLIVVDQGYLDDHWVGPQVLAHHILLLMTNDLYSVSVIIMCHDENSL